MTIISYYKWFLLLPLVLHSKLIKFLCTFYNFCLIFSWSIIIMLSFSLLNYCAWRFILWWTQNRVFHVYFNRSSKTNEILLRLLPMNFSIWMRYIKIYCINWFVRTFFFMKSICSCRRLVSELSCWALWPTFHFVLILFFDFTLFIML